MPNIEIQRTEVYETVNGVTILKEVIETEVEVATQEEVIAEKEAALLAMYKELEELKQK
jgi:hypothetical protein